MLSRFSHVWLFVTLWTAAHQAPLPMGFSKQEYWSGLPCLPPGDLPDPGIEPVSLHSWRILYCWAAGKPLVTGYSLVFQRHPELGSFAALIWYGSVIIHQFCQCRHLRKFSGICTGLLHGSEFTFIILCLLLICLLTKAQILQVTNQWEII